MFSSEGRIRAVKPYIKLGKRLYATSRQLGRESSASMKRRKESEPIPNQKNLTQLQQQVGQFWVIANTLAF